MHTLKILKFLVSHLNSASIFISQDIAPLQRAIGFENMFLKCKHPAGTCWLWLSPSCTWLRYSSGGCCCSLQQMQRDSRGFFTQLAHTPAKPVLKCGSRGGWKGVVGDEGEGLHLSAAFQNSIKTLCFRYARIENFEPRFVGFPSGYMT